VVAEGVEIKLGTVRVPLGSLHVSIDIKADGTGAVRLVALNRTMRSCIVLDLGSTALEELEELLSKVRQAVTVAKKSGQMRELSER